MASEELRSLGLADEIPSVILANALLYHRAIAPWPPLPNVLLLRTMSGDGLNTELDRRQ